MQIKVYDDVVERYKKKTLTHLWDNYTINFLKKIAGRTFEVDTEYLFSDQFNTADFGGNDPNAESTGVTGYRIMGEYVENIIDDIRAGKMRCKWCGKTSDTGEVCVHCGKKDYLEKLLTK